MRDDKNKLYIGSTTNLERRLRQHKNGHTATTHRMKNPRMVLSQEYPSIKTARKVEEKIKSLKRKDYIEKMVIDGYIRVVT